MKNFILFLACLFSASAAPWPGTTPTAQVDTLNDLVGLTLPAISNKLTVIAKGRVTANDGGGGVFFYQGASAISTNFGTVFKPAASSGRWLRQYSGDLNVKWFGAVGDGVVDDRSAITNALSLCSTNGGGIFLPTGTYRVTSGIDWPNSNFQIRMTGESVIGTYIYGNFTSASETAIIKVVGTDPIRAFAHISNMTIYGDSDPEVGGIYLHYSGQFSQLSNLRVTTTGVGVRVSLSYHLNMANVWSINNVLDGVNFGIDISGNLTGGNAFNLVNSTMVGNGRYGVSLSQVRDATLSGVTLESCGVAGLWTLDVKGLTMDSCYSEATDAAHATFAQYVINNCLGVVLNGLAVNAFRSGGDVITITNSTGVVINGLSVSTDALTTGTAVKIDGSIGVEIYGANLRNISRGVVGTNVARAVIKGVTFDNVTVPVTWPSGAFDPLEWDSVTDAILGASSLGILSPLFLTYLDQGLYITTNVNHKIARGYVDIGGIAAPSVGPSGNVRFYFDSTANKWKASENGGAYVNVIGGGDGGIHTNLVVQTSTASSNALSVLNSTGTLVGTWNNAGEISAAALSAGSGLVTGGSVNAVNGDINSFVGGNRLWMVGNSRSGNASFASGVGVGWTSSSTDANFSPDTFLSRSAIGKLALDSSFDIRGATVTSSDPALKVSQTWNNGAVVFTGILVNFTNTASAAESIIVAWQIGGVTKASVDKDGDLIATKGTFSGAVTVASGTPIAKTLSATATLNYGSILAAASETLTITVTGAAVGDAAYVGLPATQDTSTVFKTWVSAADTVSILCANVGTIAVDPASGTYRAVVVGF